MRQSLIASFLGFLRENGVFAAGVLSWEVTDAVGFQQTT